MGSKHLKECNIIDFINSITGEDVSGLGIFSTTILTLLVLFQLAVICRLFPD